MALVLDTHAVIWYLSGSKQLSPTARTVIGSAEQNAEDIFISAISLVEVIYLAEKGRLPSVALQRLQDALKDPVGSMIVAPLDAAVAEAVQRIPRETVPDMPDRIIAATASFGRRTRHARPPAAFRGDSQDSGNSHRVVVV
jgi:PIN domain nuclease of toxin-antitoxin system